MPPNGKIHKTFSHVLSIDPLVIFGLGSLGPLSPALFLSEPLKDLPVYFILGPSWDLDDPTEFYETVRRYHDHQKVYPQHFITYMVNAEHHAENLRKYGVPAFFCHHNALIDERIYRIRPAEKKYDAIYNARLDPFKRHHLARHIRSLACIYYSIGGAENVRYRDEVFETLRHAVFLNGKFENYRYLDHEVICQHVNSSHVGLVLSEV